MFILNDPFEGGTHLPDFYILKPIFVGAALVGWSASIGHQLDVGGKTPGRQRLRRDRDLPGGAAHPAGPPLRPGRARRGGVRLHRQERARAAPGPGRRALPGRRVPHRASAATSRCSSATAREGFRGLHRRAPRPGGAARAERHQGDAGRRLRVHRLHRRRRHRPRSDPDRGDDHGRRATGWSPTSPARRRRCTGAINSPIPFTKSAVYACVRHLIGGDPPNNEGYFRPIEVVAPPGTIVNPVLPASVAARGLTGFRIANARLRRARPDRARPRVRLRGGRRHRGQLRRLRRRAAGVRVPRVPLRLVGRAADPRRRRRLQQLASSTSRTTRSR